MTRKEAIELLAVINGSIYEDDFREALNMAIYDMGAIEEIKRVRDAAMDALQSALKVAQERQETVKCKDCKWWQNGAGYTYCVIARGNHPQENDYCSFAERKTDAVN